MQLRDHRLGSLAGSADVLRQLEEAGSLGSVLAITFIISSILSKLFDLSMSYYLDSII